MAAKNDARPKVVSQQDWAVARAARDALAAQRRRLPMVRIETRYNFEGPGGKVGLVNLFEGRPQLLLYHFMFAPNVDGWPSAGCPGCSMFTDNIGQFAPVHLNARGVSLALVSLAPIANIETYRKRMSWPHRWVSSANNSFNADLGITTPEGEHHGLSVFLRAGDDVFRTYFTSARGSEALGNVWGFLDATPYGRQETGEDSPPGWPQSPPYQWWRRHDEYDVGKTAK